MEIVMPVCWPGYQNKKDKNEDKGQEFSHGIVVRIMGINKYSNWMTIQK